MDRDPSSGPLPTVLRPARSEDAPLLAVLATQVFLETYATEGIRPAIAHEVLRAFSVSAMAALLARHDGMVQVAIYREHLIGFSQLTMGAGQALVESDHPAELERLYVQSPFIGRGVGRRLLRAAESEAASRGATGLWLTAWVHNARALGFYASHGYEDIGLDWFETEGERHENRVLFKRLGPGTPR
jgi:diamine N-acetyltransferase